MTFLAYKNYIVNCLKSDTRLDFAYKGTTMKLFLAKALIFLGIFKPYIGFSEIIENRVLEAKESSADGCDKPDNCSGCIRC